MKRKANNNNNKRNVKKSKAKNNATLARLQAQIRLAIARGNQMALQTLKRMYLAVA